MVGEARGHRLRRGEHVAVVAAAQRLGGVERRVLADRDEGVLQRRARAACARGRCPSPRRARRAGARARRAPRLRARSWRWNGRWSSTRKRVAARRLAAAGASSARRATPLARAAAQADEPLGVRLEVLERRPRRAAGSRRDGCVTRVRVRAREQPAEVRASPRRRARAA